MQGSAAGLMFRHRYQPVAGWGRQAELVSAIALSNSPGGDLDADVEQYGAVAPADYTRKPAALLYEWVKSHYPSVGVGYRSAQDGSAVFMRFRRTASSAMEKALRAAHQAAVQLTHRFPRVMVDVRRDGREVLFRFRYAESIDDDVMVDPSLLDDDEYGSASQAIYAHRYTLYHPRIG